MSLLLEYLEWLELNFQFDISFRHMFLFGPLKHHVSSLRMDLGPMRRGGGYEVFLIKL